MVSISSNVIDVSAILGSLYTPHSGAVDCFIGTVRNHSRGKRVKAIEYSAYIPMAQQQMAHIESEMRRKWALHNVALVHRVGLMQVGEISVITAVSSAHRAEAFEACRFAIERIKADVPIWKKEFFEEGQGWVVGQHDVDVAKGELG